jgi:hypothetical protein
VPEEEKPEPPPPEEPPFTITDTFVIGFEKDAPQVWFDPAASFSVSVTKLGKEAFNALVARLDEHPEESVQLEARASSDRPADDPDYNQRLTDRRAKLIERELEKKEKLARIADPPGQAPITGCEPIPSGKWSCGDEGAKEPADEEDRKVVARVFSETISPD